MKGGKGHERLLDRTSIPAEEMQRRWEDTFGKKDRPASPVKGLKTTKPTKPSKPA